MTVFTTYDPATIVGTALSNGNLTVTSTTTGTGSPAGNVGAHVPFADAKVAGKYYIERQFVARVGADVTIGLGNKSATYASMGQTGGGSGIALTGVSPNGHVFVEGTDKLTLGAIANGDWIAEAYDIVNKLAWFKDITQGGNWNASGTANPATGTGGIAWTALGAMVPFSSMGGTGGTTADQHKGNFGASAFLGSVPAGFTPGWAATDINQFSELLNQMF